MRPGRLLSTPSTSLSGRNVSSTPKPSRRNSGFHPRSTATPAGASSRTLAASLAAVPTGTVDLPRMIVGRVSNGARPSITASTYLRSAACSPFFWGVPTPMKCTSASAASRASVVKRSLPVATCLLMSSGRPGSKNGTSPRARVATLAASTSTPMTSCPNSAIPAAWVAPK